MHWCAKQDSNLHCTRSERVASYRLGYWRLVPAPWNRTRDLPLTGRLLCRLSYAGEKMAKRPAAPFPRGGGGRKQASINRGSRIGRGAAGQIWTFTMSNSKGFRRNIGCDSRRRRRRARRHGRAHRVEVERGRDARRRPRERISAFDRSVMRLADVSRAILVPPACRRRDAPAAGYSGRIDPGRVVLFEEYSSAARTTHPPPSGRDDQALEALSAVYVPRWRIGFPYRRPRIRPTGRRLSQSLRKKSS